MAKKHTHMYHKIQKKYGSGVWACALPNCTHYLPSNVADMIFGRESLCTNCMSLIVLDEHYLRNDEPVCNGCAGIALPKDFDIDEYMREQKGKRKEEERKLVVRGNDVIEVIEANEEHAPDCGVYDGLDCTCKT